jgi:hypothetical protein
MFWLAALAAAAIIGSIARNAWQDHRDAELQRRDALDDIARPRSWRKQRSLSTGERLRLGAGSEGERVSEAPVQRPVAAPRPMDARTQTPPHGARML